MMSQIKKTSVVLVYTGDGKGKTSAAIGLACRALGAGKRVAFVQFIKAWTVSEHRFFAQIASGFNEKVVSDADAVQGFSGETFTFFKGGKGFFHAGAESAKNKTTGEKISDDEHLRAARETYDFAKKCVLSGEFDLVVCDEINNAVNDGLISRDDLKQLIVERNPQTSLCLTGRNWPAELNEFADIITEMTKVKHHYDDGFLAEIGIDF
jgi:cob(I)alamin adenosyltransferase